MSGRIRSVKPETAYDENLFDAEESTGLPLRFAFVMLWCHADKEGRFEWRPRALKPRCLPLDDVSMSDVLGGLEAAKLVRRYTAGGREYGWIRSFRKHQRPNHREAESIIPPHPDDAGLSTPGVPGQAQAGQSPCASIPPGGKGREGKGREWNGGVPAATGASDQSRDGFGRCAEWDKSLALMTDLRLDDKARARVKGSALDDMALYRVLCDVRDARPANPSSYATKAVKNAEAIA